MVGLLCGSGVIFFAVMVSFVMRKKFTLDTNTDNFDDVGDPDEARINLSRSLFEMGQTAKAQRTTSGGLIKREFIGRE